MTSKKKTPSSPNNRHDFAKALPAFDKAMQSLVKVPKAEIERKLHAEREAKAAKK